MKTKPVPFSKIFAGRLSNEKEVITSHEMGTDWEDSKIGVCPNIGMEYASSFNDTIKVNVQTTPQFPQSPQTPKSPK